MERESDQDPCSMTSIVHILPSEAFPKKMVQKEDPSLTAPFPPLIGENVEYIGRTTEGTIALSNYRLFIHLSENKFFNIVLGMVDSVECRDIFYLYIHCKDARTVRCTFATNELCQDWYKRLLVATAPPKKMEDIFAFGHCAWNSQEPKDDQRQSVTPDNRILSLEFEARRMGFNLEMAWRISRVNERYKLCSSYPRDLLVPKGVEDDVLTNVATFRSSQRIPAVVWRHPRNGSVIARCSQPEVGWLGWRNANDENLIQAIAVSCALNGVSAVRDHEGEGLAVSDGASGREPLVNSDHAAGGHLDVIGKDSTQTPTSVPKVLIVDARSYAAAVANRAKGGGCECPEYYPNCEIQFMSLANIHSIRRSFQSIRTLCAFTVDQPNWFSILENTKWLQNISGLLKSALVVVNAVDREGRPVVVHCSDGWDRTPQIVALAELMLDPYYRTFQGFQVLVEREWLEFGHKFGDRCGHGLQADDTNERCPVFLQWLDCVHQLWNQFPLCFEFNENFLVKLAQHVYSCLFGTFLCNSSQERRIHKVQERTYSVWPALQNSKKQFYNYLYEKTDLSGMPIKVLRPAYQLRDLSLWTAVYVHSDYVDDLDAASDYLGNPDQEEGVEEMSSPNSDGVAVDSDKSKGVCESAGGINGLPSLTKTKSCADLSAVATERAPFRSQRRSSDPSVEKGACLGAVEGVVPSSTMDLEDSEEDADDRSADFKPPNSGVDGEQEVDSPDDTLSGDQELQPLWNGGELNGHCRGTVSDDEEDTDPTVSDERTRELTRHSAIESSTDTLVGDVGSDVKAAGHQVLKQQDHSQAESELHILEENCLHVSTSTTDISDSRVVNCCGMLNNGVIKSLKSHLLQQRYQSTLPWNGSGGAHELAPAPSCGAQLLSGHNCHHHCTGTDCTLMTYSKCPPLCSAGCSGGVSGGCNGCTMSTHHGHLVMEAALKQLSNASSVPSPLTTTCVGMTNGVKCQSSNVSTPLHSRTPSSGFPATPNDDRSTCDGVSHRGDSSASSSSSAVAAVAGASSSSVGRRLDTDGLSLIQDRRQKRLHEIFAEHHDQMRAMEQKVYMLQVALLQQQKCCKHSRGNAEWIEDEGSLPDSAGNGEQQSLGHDSAAASDSSWEHVDEQDTRLTRWVPDHAAFRCKGCDCEFFALRRKHHCRNCGEVFCWECSKFVIPIPNEQLYKPARVCSWCYEQLRYNPQACTVVAAAASARDEDKFPNPVVATAAASN